MSRLYYNPSGPLDIIKMQGDLLERHIFKDDEFSAAFDLYPTVWALYILEARGEGTITLADSTWLRFAERHYSTIVRCWMALECRRDLEIIASEAVGSPSAAHHVKVHRLMFEFYCCLGAAIDNLRHTFIAPPIECQAAFDRIYGRSDRSVPLRYLFERRTQFIHKALVPCFNHEGLLSIDASMLKDVETRWDQRQPMVISEVTAICGFHWGEFVMEMRCAWSKLLDLLRSYQPKTTADIDFSPLPPQSLGWGSGSPPPPDSPDTPGPGPSGVR
jgi:hypothetical protein